MTLPFVPYPEGVLYALTQPAGSPFNLTAYPLKLMLCTSAYVPSNDHATKADITGELATGGGYAAGGQALTGVNVARVDTLTTLDADDVIWVGATLAGVRFEVLYLDSGADDAHRPLVGYIDNETDQAAVAEDFVVQWADQGIYQFERV